MMRSFSAVAVLALLAVGSLAHAVDHLAWRWGPEQERRYFLQTTVTVPEYVTLWTDRNDQPVLKGFQLAANIRCKHTDSIGKSTVALRCTFDDLALSGDPVSTSEGAAKEALDLWAAELEGDDIWVEVLQTSQGKLRSIEVKGLVGFDRKSQLRVETMKQMVERLLAPLDVHLPRKGDDNGNGTWAQREARAFRMMSRQGSMGGIRMRSQIAAERGDSVIIGLTGEGTIASGETLDSVVHSTYSVQLVGSYRFDRAEGAVVESQYSAKGIPTASAGRAEGVAGTRYDQTSLARLLGPDEEAPELGDNEEY